MIEAEYAKVLAEVVKLREELEDCRKDAERASRRDRVVSSWWSNLPDSFCAEYNAADSAMAQEGG